MRDGSYLIVDRESQPEIDRGDAVHAPQADVGRRAAPSDEGPRADPGGLGRVVQCRP
jgi:hypothetical protein